MGCDSDAASKQITCRDGASPRDYVRVAILCPIAARCPIPPTTRLQLAVFHARYLAAHESFRDHVLTQRVTTIAPIVESATLIARMSYQAQLAAIVVDRLNSSPSTSTERPALGRRCPRLPL